jgi:acyl-CoA reductase-like NAD-dependent aldehyde dehydrogenase
MSDHVVVDTEVYGNYIAGEFLPAAAGERYERSNPSAPGEVVGSFASSTAADVDAAVGAADSAYEAWASTPAPARGRIIAATARVLESRLDQVAHDMTCEMGKPIREARAEVARSVAILDFFAGEGQRPFGEVYEQSASSGAVHSVRRPVGVVGLITPWNFPAAIPTWKAAPALAFGNSVVLKLANDAPRTGLHLAECFDAAGLPPGVLNVVTGFGSEAGAPLVADPRVTAVSFTGSVAVGEGVRAAVAGRGGRVQLELGGHNPLIVAVDASLDAAVEAAYAGAFWSAGQKCTATRRIYVHATIYDAFRERLCARIARGLVGDPLDPATEVGPLVNERQRDDVLAAIDRGRKDGGTVLTGGGAPDLDGWFVEPTVFEGVADDAYLSCEEVFGPVTTLYAFDDVDEAIARANRGPFGLSASIFTDSIATSERFIRGVRAGILHVNSQTAGAEAHVPFGGTKGSGYGPHEQGRTAIEFYTDLVTVYRDV